LIRSKHTFIIGLIAGLSFCTLAAQRAPGGWLAEAWKDSSYKKIQAQADFRARHPLTIPWLNKWEFRTQTNDFNFKQQQYALRFSASDPTEVIYRKRMESVDVNLYRHLSADALHDALAARYRLLVDYYWIDKQDSLYREQQALQLKKKLYLESLFQHQLDAELKDLIQAYRKNEKIKHESAVVEDTRKKAHQQSKHIGSGVSIGLDGFHWIQPFQIRILLQNDPGPVPVSASYARLLQNKTQAELESLRLKSDHWNLLEFLQARWRNNVNDELIKEKISLSAGIRLPFAGGKRRDQNMIVLEKMQIESELARSEDQYKLKTTTLRLELESLLDRLEEQQKQLTTFEGKFRQPALLSNPLVKPQDILLIDETILDWKEEIIRIEKDLMEKYVEYLVYTRIISTPPYKNYLESTMEDLRIEE